MRVCYSTLYPISHVPQVPSLGRSRMNRVGLCVAINVNNQKGPFSQHTLSRDGDLPTILLASENMLEVLKPQAEAMAEDLTCHRQCIFILFR
jgi:hypothetical protein